MFFPFFIPRPRVRPRRLRLLLLAPAVALVLPLAGCGSYPVNVQTNYLNACEAKGGSSSRCNCTLDWLESNVSYTQFQADDAYMRELWVKNGVVMGRIKANYNNLPAPSSDPADTVSTTNGVPDDILSAARACANS